MVSQPNATAETFASRIGYDATMWHEPDPDGDYTIVVTLACPEWWSPHLLTPPRVCRSAGDLFSHPDSVQPGDCFVDLGVALDQVATERHAVRRALMMRDAAAPVEPARPHPTKASAATTTMPTDAATAPASFAPSRPVRPCPSRRWTRGS